VVGTKLGTADLDCRTVLTIPHLGVPVNCPVRHHPQAGAPLVRSFLAKRKLKISGSKLPIYAIWQLPRLTEIRLGRYKFLLVTEEAPRRCVRWQVYVPVLAKVEIQVPVQVPSYC
jgi:hypothetical protein